MAIQHKNLAAGGWQKLSLMEQLGNVGGKEYQTTLEDLNRYFFQFALAARINR